MTAAAAGGAVPGRPSPAGNVSDFELGTCSGCKNRLRRVVLDGGSTVQIDGRDPEGEVWARKVDGRWQFRRGGVDTATPAGVFRYLEHRCPDADIETRAAELLGPAPTPRGFNPPTLGPCAGNCGKHVTKYGGYPGNEPEMMCSGCKQALADWRARPGPHRGPIPFGKWVGDKYVQR